MDATLTLTELFRIIYQNVSKSQSQWPAASPALDQIMRRMVMYNAMLLLLFSLKQKARYYL